MSASAGSSRSAWPRISRPAAAMRAGADDAELARRFVVSIGGKLAGHGIDDPGFLQPARPMSAIGG